VSGSVPDTVPEFLNPLRVGPCCRPLGVPTTRRLDRRPPYRADPQWAPADGVMPAFTPPIQTPAYASVPSTYRGTCRSCWPRRSQPSALRLPGGVAASERWSSARSCPRPRPLVPGRCQRRRSRTHRRLLARATDTHRPWPPVWYRNPVMGRAPVDDAVCPAGRPRAPTGPSSPTAVPRTADCSVRVRRWTLDLACACGSTPSTTGLPASGAGLVE